MKHPHFKLWLQSFIHHCRRYVPYNQASTAGWASTAALSYPCHGLSYVQPSWTNMLLFFHDSQRVAHGFLPPVTLVRRQSMNFVAEIIGEKRPPARAFPAFPTFRQMRPGISGGSGSPDVKWSVWTEAHTLPAVPHTQRRGQKRIQSCGVIQCLLDDVCGRLQHIYIQTMQRRSPLNAYVYMCVQLVIYIPSCM